MNNKDFSYFELKKLMSGKSEGSEKGSPEKGGEAGEQEESKERADKAQFSPASRNNSSSGGKRNVLPQGPRFVSPCKREDKEVGEMAKTIQTSNGSKVTYVALAPG